MSWKLTQELWVKCNWLLFWKRPKEKEDLHVLRTQRMNEYTQRVYVPPMAKPSLNAPNDSIFPLMDNVKTFLASDRQVMLILGGSGAGKSTFNRHLEYELWKEYKSGGRIPLFINMPVLEQPDTELIQEQLKIHSFSESQIQELKQHRQFILICDGYDESQLNCNLHTTNCLNRPGQPDTKLIVSCRSEYLGQDYRDRFVPNAVGHDNRPANHLFQECVIAPFTKVQIEEYVTEYALSGIWNKRSYMNALETIPNLINLVQNPFLLTLCLEFLPDVVQSGTDLSMLRMTRVQLYDNFVRYWLKVNKQRLHDIYSQLEREDQMAFEALLEDGFEKNGVMYQRELAKSIFHEQDGHPIVDYTLSDIKKWKAALFGKDPANGLLRDSSLLTRLDTGYQFSHRSILEYFYSCTICGPIDEDGTSDLHPRLPISGHPLSKRDLVRELSIIRFLAERTVQDSNFKLQLFEILDQSKDDENAARAAANAITILVKAGIRFNGQDLRGIHIPGADLSGGEFDSVQLQDADLTGVNLTKSWIRQANFTNAHMKGVRFGEQPYLDIGRPIYSCACSPDGRTFAAGVRGGDIIIYDAASWTETHIFKGHSNDVYSLAFSPSGDRLLSGSDDKTVRLWTCASGSLEFVLEGHTECVTSVAYSPCGKLVASASDDITVRLWDAKSGVVTSVLSGLAKPANEIALSPDGTYISLAGRDGTIRVFNTRTGKAGLVIQTRTSIRSAAYLPDGTRLVSGNIHGDIQLWELATGTQLQSWKGHISCICRVIVSHNGQWIASCSFDNTVKLWLVQTGRLVSSFIGHSNTVRDAVFSQDDMTLISGSFDDTVRFWDLSIIEPGSINENNIDRLKSVYSSDGHTIVSPATFGVVQLYNSSTGELERTTNCRHGYSLEVGVLPDGLLVATVECETVYVFSTKSGVLKHTLSDHTNQVNDVTFSPCGHMIATGSDDMTICLWNADTGVLVRKFIRHESRVTCLRFSSDSQQIVSVDIGGNILVWEVGSGESKMLNEGNEHTVASGTGVGFSPINSLITAVCLTNTTIRIWNQLGNELLHSLEHKSPIVNFAWSYCEQWIATNGNNSIHLWNRSSDGSREWTCTLVIHDFQTVVRSIDWKSDILEFVTSCKDGSIRVWKLNETMDGWSAQLVWSVGGHVLVATDAIYSTAKDLNTTSQRLLEQRSKMRQNELRPDLQFIFQNASLLLKESSFQINIGEVIDQLKQSLMTLEQWKDDKLYQL